MVFDHSGRYLYVSTSDGVVQRYNRSSGTFDASINVGGSLRGMDIARDDSFLLIAQNDVSGGQGTFHRVDLASGAVIAINYPLTSYEGGGWSVAIAANGRALVTTQFNGSGMIPLRQIDLASNTISTRMDVPNNTYGNLQVQQKTQIERSADGTRLYLLQPNISTGPVSFYDAATDSFSEVTQTHTYLDAASAAVSRDGRLLATRLDYGAALDAAQTLSFRHSFGASDSGLCFDPSSDVLYVVAASIGQIIAYDSTTFAEKFRLDIGEQLRPIAAPLDTGTLTVSPDGRCLALATPAGIRVFSVAAGGAAPRSDQKRTPRKAVFDHSGKYLYISTTQGIVQRYDLSLGQVTREFDLDGTLNGLDIAPDDSCLLVAQANTGLAEGMFEKIEVATGVVTPLNYRKSSFVPGEAGGWEVSIGSNTIALVTTNYDGSGWVPLREINLATNTVTERQDAPGSAAPMVRGATQLHRSWDESCLYVIEADGPGGPVFTYNSKLDRFSSAAQTGYDHSNGTGAVNYNGSLLATRHSPALSANKGVSFDTAEGFHYQGFIGELESGVAFDGVSNTLYAVDSRTSDLVAYAPPYHRERFRIPIGEKLGDLAGYEFEEGTLTVSGNGLYAAVNTRSGIRVLRLPTSDLNAPPSAVPALYNVSEMVFDPAGTYLYIATTKGLIHRYNLASKSFDTPIELGGALNAVDIDTAGSFLLVAQGRTGLIEGAFQKVDLASGKVTMIPYRRTQGGYESGASDVAVSLHGRAFGTTSFEGSGSVPIWQLDLISNLATPRAGPSYDGLVAGGSRLARSADASVLHFFDEYRGTFTYNATSDSFGQVVPASFVFDRASAALSRDGSLLATHLSQPSTSLERVSDRTLLHTFDGLDGGIAFDPTSDTLFGASGAARQIIAYDSNVYTERYRFDIGADSTLATGRNSNLLVASPDGESLALRTASTIRVFNLPARTSTVLMSPNSPLNISSRALVQPNDRVAIAGFIVTGILSKDVVVRGIGPSLTAASVTGALEDPIIELYDAKGTLIAHNDNWNDVGNNPYFLYKYNLQPTDTREAAMAASLAPGAYSVVLRGKADSSGVGLVEVYDVDPKIEARLANISTRAVVGTGDNVLIGGLIIGGAANFPDASTRVAVRAIGPSLATYGVGDALQNPALELHGMNGDLIASNNDWSDSQAAEIQSVGLQPTDIREAALIANLVPGSYSVIVRGQDGETGIAVVEAFALE